MTGLLGAATGWSNQELHLHLTVGKARLENSLRLPWGHPPVGTGAESASQAPGPGSPLSCNLPSNGLVREVSCHRGFLMRLLSCLIIGDEGQMKPRKLGGEQDKHAERQDSIIQ